MNAQRNFKDTVGRMLFARPENALQLYNALNGTDYTDSSVIEFNTLENAIYLGMKNDLSFIIAYRTSLYEFQSTITPNMPLRNLFYISDIFQGYVRNRTLYSSRCIKIPAPRFIVLYNGIRPMPEQVEYKLSDAFEVHEEDPQLELKVTVLNINEGMNEELKSRCPVLKEYMEYVGAVRRNMEHMPLDEAVDAAIEYCIKNNILKDFLLEQKAEVKKMSIYEFDEEREMEMIRQDERSFASVCRRRARFNGKSGSLRDRSLIPILLPIHILLPSLPGYATCISETLLRSHCLWVQTQTTRLFPLRSLPFGASCINFCCLSRNTSRLSI